MSAAVTCTLASHTPLAAMRYSVGLAITGSQVQISLMAAVYQCQFSVQSLRGQLMSSSLQATEWRPSAADWGGGISVMLHRGSTCALSQAVDGYIMHHGMTNSCQSATTSKIEKHCWSSGTHASSALACTQDLQHDIHYTFVLNTQPVLFHAANFIRMCSHVQ